MKQKIVIRVCGICCDKCRSKAMAVAAATGGVDSVAIDGKHRDELVVVGECVDSAKLATALRKKVGRGRRGRADILEVSEVKNKDVDKKPPPPKPPVVDEGKKDDKKPPPPQQQPAVTFVCHPLGYAYYSCYCYCHCHYHYH